MVSMSGGNGSARSALSAVEATVGQGLEQIQSTRLLNVYSKLTEALDHIGGDALARQLVTDAIAELKTYCQALNLRQMQEGSTKR